MNLRDILTLERVFHGLSAVSKKRTLEQAAGLIARQFPELDAGDLFNALVSRERLGSTGIGHGIAIPHARIKQCPTTVGALVTLKTPIDFDSIDNQPVDILFILLVPENAHKSHLDMLALIAKYFSDETVRNELRRAPDAASIYDIICRFAPPQQHA